MPTPIDAYLEPLPAAQRRALQKLREQILSVIPGAEECISYGLAAFRVRGKVVAGFQARTSGCSYYPFSGNTLGTLAKELAGWKGTKSAVHFETERPLPLALVRRLVKARLAELPPVPVAPRRSPARKGPATKGRMPRRPAR